MNVLQLRSKSSCHFHLLHKDSLIISWKYYNFQSQFPLEELYLLIGEEYRKEMTEEKNIHMELKHCWSKTESWESQEKNTFHLKDVKYRIIELERIQ